MDRTGLEVLSAQECDRLLAENVIGRVAFVADGEPVVLPVNYRLHRGAVVFRTARGEKLEAAARRAPVAFEIDGWDPDTQTGWSVLVRGVAEEVLDEDQVAELETLGLRPWADSPQRRIWVRIRREDVTGRRVQ
jgi:nitroimidazol reductase NimA-like FMN-containing flavoprotein (pyridoxamine 5'-phosphate oxidase superfamily)